MTFVYFYITLQRCILIQRFLFKIVGLRRLILVTLKSKKKLNYIIIFECADF